MVAAALLDRLLHHVIVIEIAGNSYWLREHAKLVPDGTEDGVIEVSNAAGQCAWRVDPPGASPLKR